MSRAVRAAFRETFGSEPDLVVRSPGRVNLIGEHTDYNEGFVLPMALDLGTDVAARVRPDRRLHVTAPRMGAADERPVGDLRLEDAPDWMRYVGGCAAVLRDTARELPGVDLLVDGDLPLGGGLSSSASLELGVLVALTALTGEELPPAELARLGQRVENEIVGVRSGIMDQLCVAAGRAGSALLIDCRTLAFEPVPLPADVRVLVLDSAVPRTLAGSAYNERRAQCESGLAKLQRFRPDLRALRDVTEADLAAHGDALPDVEFRRARHVVTEDARVLAAADALRAGDAVTFGELMTASHASMRDDYEISGPELDILVEIALATRGVLGARLTGAGFGGCAVALTTAGVADDAAATISGRYRQQTGRPGSAWVCAPSEGAHVAWRASG